ncbi:MAG: phosphotransferase, partial [Dongiaceae bacterium]
MIETSFADSLRPSPALARAAHALVGRYAFAADAVVELLHQSENTMYLVRDSEHAEKFVLRIHSHRMSYHVAPSILSELRWMAALRCDALIETPEAIPARDGSLVQTLAHPDLGTPRLAVMFTFLDGGEPSEARLVAEFQRLGEVTARMHRHARDWTRPAGFQRHSWTAETILSERPLWGRWQNGVGMDGPAIRVIERMARVIERRLGGLARDREGFGLIHADMRLANLLVEGERTKVIDFDDCGFGWFAYDLATALSFIQERVDVPILVDAWLAGYRRSMRFPPDIAAEIPTFI